MSSNAKALLREQPLGGLETTHAAAAVAAAAKRGIGNFWNRLSGHTATRPPPPSPPCRWADKSCARAQPLTLPRQVPWLSLAACLLPHCTQVVTETTDVAASTIVSLYTQGQQLDRAAHGLEQVGAHRHCCLSTQ